MASQGQAATAEHGAANDSGTKSAHFVFVPLMVAQGHLIPAVDTALLLATHGAVCTIVGTPSMAKRVRATIESARQSGLQVRLVDFPLDYSRVDLPEGADGDGNVPAMHMWNYFRAVALLRAPIESYLREHAPYPTCVVSDFCHPWTTELAANLGVPRLSFFSMCAFYLLCQHNIERFNAYDGVVDDNEPVIVPGLERRIEVTRAQAQGFFRRIPIPCWQEFADYVERASAEADGVIMNTFLEMDPEYVAGYAAARKMKVWTVGPVSFYHQGVETLATRGSSNTIVDADECLRWLDGKEPNSVVYVSFGSVSQAGPKQVVELGLGLEASGYPFILVVKDSGEYEYDETVLDFLRELEVRVAGRGLLLRAWAPQVLILNHAAVGGFVTHCGWNSTLEAITAGLPVVTWPHFSDQFLNEKMTVDILGIGVSVGVKERLTFQAVKKEVVVGRDVVEKAVRSVMDGGAEGEERRRRARALAAKARASMQEGGSSHANLLDLVKRFETGDFFWSSRATVVGDISVDNETHLDILAVAFGTKEWNHPGSASLKTTALDSVTHQNQEKTHHCGPKLSDCLDEETSMAGQIQAATAGPEAADDSRTGTNAAHFVFVPLMMKGHLIPAVDTALQLARHGAICTVVGTPATAVRVRPTIESAQQSGIPVRLVEFPLDYAGTGLPEGADSGDMVPAMYFWNYLQALALLRAPIESYLREHSPYPTCVVSDFSHPWTTELAANLGVPRLTFFSMCAFGLLCQHNIERFNAYDGVADANEPVVVPGLEKRIEVTRAQAPGFFRGIPIPCWEEFADYVERARAEADGVIMNSFLEMEPEYVAGYAAARKMKVWTVGPVSLYHQGVATLAARGNGTAVDAGECIRWLDGKEPNSVVYVSFGSICMAQADPKQVVELGLGLEASGHPFIWVVGDAAAHGETVRDFLRELEARVAGRGLLIRGWAPQVLILSHAAVGGFVTHCGWNSTLEAITAGLPVVTWPHFTDQFLNEKMAVELLGIGVSVGVKEPLTYQAVKKEIVVGRDVVEKAVRSVMDGGEEGEQRRRRARALADKARAAVEVGGSSHANLLDLVKRFGLGDARDATE
ncbi:hypothetical protein EJB05_45730, partial [Eragrostis curvula]